MYYDGIPVSQEELECKAIIDHLHTDNPTWGARQMSAQLKLRGYHIGRRKAGRYMREMDITPIYPKIVSTTRMYLRSVVNAGNGDGYSEKNEIDIDDPHYNWKLGEFFVSDFTRLDKES